MALLKKVFVLTVALFVFVQTIQAGDFSIDANRFKSSPFVEDGYFSVYSGAGLDAGLFGLGFLMHYMPDSISTFDSEGKRLRSVIENQFSADISLFYSPVKFFDLGLVLPIIIYQNGDGWNEFDSIPSGGVGDIRLVPRFQIVNVSNGLFALSLIPEITAPTGELVHSAMGSSQFTFKPSIAMGSESKWVGFTTNFFYQVLQKQYFADSVFDDEFGVKVALDLHAVPKVFDIVAEFHANTAIVDPFDNKAVDNIELGGGFKVKTPVDLDISAGAYGGFGNAVGLPKFRVFLGVSWNMDISKKPEPKEEPKPVVEKKPEPKEEPKPVVEKKPEPKEEPKTVVEKKPETKPQPKPAPRSVERKPVKKTGEKLSAVIYFSRESDYIEDALEIEKIALILTRNFMLKIRIEAHTDISEKNSIATKRAQNVRSVLIKNGVEPERIKITVIGSKEPVSKGDTEPDKAKNRRVEFFMITD